MSVVKINTYKIVVFHSTFKSHFKALDSVSVSVLTVEVWVLSFGLLFFFRKNELAFSNKRRIILKFYSIRMVKSFNIS